MTTRVRVVTTDTTFDNNREGALTVTPGGRLRTEAGAVALSGGVDRSGQIDTNGVAKQMAPANAARTSLTGQNISSADLWINEMGGTAAVDAAGSYRIPANGMFSVKTNRAVSVVGATAGQKWSATET